jgi:hypothetical protein
MMGLAATATAVVGCQLADVSCTARKLFVYVMQYYPTTIICAWVPVACTAKPEVLDYVYAKMQKQLLCFAVICSVLQSVLLAPCASSHMVIHGTGSTCSPASNTAVTMRDVGTYQGVYLVHNGDMWVDRD